MKPKPRIIQLFFGFILFIFLFSLLNSRVQQQRRERQRRAAQEQVVREQTQRERARADNNASWNRFRISTALFEVPTITETTVQRRFGTGYFIQGEKASDSDSDVSFHSKSNGRYYLDREQTVTLHVRTSEAGEINEIEFQQGNHLPGKSGADVLQQATTPHLSAQEKIEDDFTLGTPAKAMMGFFKSKPVSDTQKQHKRTLLYQESTEMGGYNAVFRFQNDRLVYVRLLRWDEFHP